MRQNNTYNAHDADTYILGLVGIKVYVLINVFDYYFAVKIINGFTLIFITRRYSDDGSLPWTD